MNNNWKVQVINFLLLVIIALQVVTLSVLIKVLFAQKDTQLEQSITQEESTAQIYIIELNIETEPFETNPVAETYYDTLSSEEIFLLEVTIQHEVGNFSKTYKRYVAELIYNRIQSEDFPDTVKEVLFQQGQFQGIQSWAYSGIEIDNETREVIYEVFSKQHTTHPATFYYNPSLSEYESVMWFEYSGDVEYVFSHTETSWGVEYETKFFVWKEKENGTF